MVGWGNGLIGYGLEFEVGEPRSNFSRAHDIHLCVNTFREDMNNPSHLAIKC